MTIFTAQNAAHLSQQIDTFTAQHPDFVFCFGRDTRQTWYCHAEYGNRPRNKITFAEVVEIATREALLQIEFESCTA